MYPISQLCERARAWASLRADGELSELESALLDAHLGRCDSCRSFAVGTETVAETLRAVPLERPVVALGPTSRSGGRRAWRALQITAAAALVVATGVVAAASGPGPRPATSVASKPVAMVAGIESPDLLRELRRPGLIERQPMLPRNGLVPVPV
jgi:ferric-dicitrate binding protein FerR (iron transport regulator)